MKAALDQALTVSALRWMLLAQFLSLALHLPRMPIGLMALLGLCTVWRLQIIRGRWRLPNSSIKVMLATAGLIILVLSFEKLSVMAAVSFLLLAYGLKLIELHTQRDAYISLFLSFLVVAINFLFETSIAIAFVVLLVCIIITCALVAMHSLKERSTVTLLRQSSLYWLSAIPLMVIFFVFFPRMAPLWSLDLGGGAKTGLSDNMSPGDIAKLTQSDELVFRARFERDLPIPPTGLYWRALILDKSDGRGWKRASAVDYSGELIDWYGEPKSYWQENLTVEGPFYPYEVILEPTHQPWLFSLDGAYPEQPHVGLTQDFMLQYDKSVRQALRYSSQLPTNVIREPQLARWRGGRELQLPENENPKTRALAQAFWEETKSVSGFVDKVLTYFVDNQFRYTLKPPLLGEKANDEFLFETRQGFCGHYAGALALMARYAGIPARVVAGYLGGEWNANARYLSVRQYDAHAWTEIWVPEKGWTVVDPTSVIAPDRIELGLAEAMREEGSFLEDSLLSPHRYQGLAIMDSIRQLVDNINYQWSLRVVGFDVKKQTGILADLVGQWGRYAWLVIASMVLAALLLPFLIWGGYRLIKQLTHHRTNKQRFESLLIRSLSKAEKKNSDYPNSGEASVSTVDKMTPRQLFQMLAEHHPEHEPKIKWLSQTYEELCYGRRSDVAFEGQTESTEKQWRFLLKQLKQLDIK
ncbi:transglutaminaseTgpA domain-containing protein [Litoribrevibacter euphylliae]|uniref:TransglutaminaseTgpA domain-containing protein n=1 Tax=Litoribrevibacter euphylliae TaxID=1834034 RepID=A0ABV7H7K4_9GAMM